MCEEPEPYDGPFVVIEPEQRGQYRVSIEPPIPLDLSAISTGRMQLGTTLKTYGQFLSCRCAT
jgi:hypothetical protein